MYFDPAALDMSYIGSIPFHSIIDIAYASPHDNIQRDIFPEELEYRCSWAEYNYIKLYMNAFFANNNHIEKTTDDILALTYDSIYDSVSKRPEDELFGSLRRECNGYGFIQNKDNVLSVINKFEDLGLVQNNIDTERWYIDRMVYPEFDTMSCDGYLTYEDYTEDIPMDASIDPVVVNANYDGFKSEKWIEFEYDTVQ